MSSRGVKDMDYDDKRRSLEKTLRAAKDRVALQTDNEQEYKLGQRVDQFISEIQSLPFTSCEKRLGHGDYNCACNSKEDIDKFPPVTYTI